MNRATLGVLIIGFLVLAIIVQESSMIKAQVGENWALVTEQAGWSPRYFHASVAFDNKMWVIGGYSLVNPPNDVWYSSDGENWTLATKLNAGWEKGGHTAVVFNDAMWVMGGWDSYGNSYNDVWFSLDGTNWTEATANAGWTPRGEFAAVVFDKIVDSKPMTAMWIFGGWNQESQTEMNDVWYSFDGENWTEATANAGWGTRSGHTAVVFDDKMWIMGGYDHVGNHYNDVWYSFDGENWTEATANAGWTWRIGHTSVVFGGGMWILGGSGDSYYNDVWVSSDGANWKEVTANAEWSPRYFHTSVVFNDKMWVIGGENSEGSRVNDVWQTPPPPPPPPPGKPVLYLPAQSRDNDNTPYFEWTKGENADNHRFLVDNDSDFSSPNENRVFTTENSYTITGANSLPDDNYSWKVIAINAFGETSSDVWTFVVDTTPHVSPPENLLGQSVWAPPFVENQYNPMRVLTSTPRFSAVYLDNVDRKGAYFQVQVGSSGGDNNKWDSGWVNIADVGYLQRCEQVEYGSIGGAAAPLGYYTLYYWRYRFKDNLGDIGTWSDVQKFYRVNLSDFRTYRKITIDNWVNQPRDFQLLLDFPESRDDYIILESFQGENERVGLAYTNNKIYAHSFVPGAVRRVENSDGEIWMWYGNPRITLGASNPWATYVYCDRLNSFDGWTLDNDYTKTLIPFDGLGPWINVTIVRNAQDGSFSYGGGLNLNTQAFDNTWWTYALMTDGVSAYTPYWGWAWWRESKTVWAPAGDYFFSLPTRMEFATYVPPHEYIYASSTTNYFYADNQEIQTNICGIFGSNTPYYITQPNWENAEREFSTSGSSVQVAIKTTLDFEYLEGHNGPAGFNAWGGTTFHNLYIRKVGGGGSPTLGGEFFYNHPPTCKITVPPDGYSTLFGNSIQFACIASDPDDDPLTYLWQFGDGKTSIDMWPAYTYSSVGSYSVNLIVSDSQLSGSDSITVHVTQPPPPPPPPHKEYTLTTYAIGQGTVIPGGTTLHNPGETVTINAIPATDWTFDHWVGDLSGIQNPATINMDGNKTVGAYFLQIYVPPENWIPGAENKTSPFLPPLTPSGTKTPDWLWLLLLVAFCVLESEIMRKDEWGRTPRNTAQGSKPGTWTFIWSPEGSIIVLVLGLLGLGVIYDIFGTSTAFWIYASFISIAGLAVIVEHLNPKLFPAYIDLGQGGELGRLVAGGAVMGAIWLLLTGLLTDWLGVTYVVSPIINIPWLRWPVMSIAIGIAFIGFLAPVIEEQCFRQTLAPSLAEKLGIMPGIAISGALFGVAHYIFGGSIALAVSATGFGMVLAYFVLRHQGAAFAYAAHITYNMLIIIISYIMWVV